MSDDLAAEFRRLVNLRPAELRRWLETEESRSVGWRHEGESESVGHHSGRRILSLLEQDTSSMGEEDVGLMREVVGYIHRHLAQRPEGDVSAMRWRYSLMNWGHDPEK